MMFTLHVIFFLDVDSLLFYFAIKLSRGADTYVCNNESSSSHHTRRLTRNMIRDYPGNYGLLVGRQGAAVLHKNI